MAGAGYKLFNTGDVLLASEVNTYLQQQVTMVFANATARTSALSGVLAEGMMSYLQDTNTVEVYDGSNWVSVGNTGDITGITTGANSGLTGGVTSGTADLKVNFASKGQLAVGTGSGTTGFLNVGTNGHTLVADSAETTGLKWAAPAGGLTQISRTTFSNVASQIFDSVFTSTYKAYLVVIEKITAATGTDDIHFQWRYGSTTSTASYYGNSGYLNQGSASWTISQVSNASQMTIANTTGAAADGNATSGQFWCYRVGNTSEKAFMTGTSFTDDGWWTNMYGGSINSAQTYTGFLLKSSSTNISGTVTIYGLAA